MAKKRLCEGFKNVFTYAAGMEQWAQDNLVKELKYTFVSDFAIADWMGGEKAVRETYSRVKKSWLNSYKAFTEVVISLNMLSWAHHRLIEQGFSGREPFVKLYSDLYYQARDDFYKEYEKNREACDYFFEMTD